MKRVLFVVEGQTEERFVKDVLKPALEKLQLYVTVTIVATKVVKDGPNFKGGLVSFGQFRDHVTRVLTGSGGALVTTIVDYYGLPEDFPGMNNRPQPASSRERVLHVQRALWQALGEATNFLPFIALHEFEAWLFSDAVSVPQMMAMPEKLAEFAAIANVLTPEDINEHPNTAPSKRLAGLYPGYRKPLHGPPAAARIGLDLIGERCPHFAEWYGRLNSYAQE